MKIAFIPIDDRPVCYNLPKEIAQIDRNLQFFIPDRELLGGLHSIANIDGIFDWLKTIPKVDALIVSLDTIAYGGLIPSRRSNDTVEEIVDRLKKFKKLVDKNTKVYAVSSIMRISNNNCNEEEKKYWNLFGERIFEYSYKFHELMEDETDIPKDIIDDYLATRRRNFIINKLYVEWFKDGFFSTLVFSKDDCAKYGFNVFEAEILESMLNQEDVENAVGLIKTGADEIPLSLMSRAIAEYNNIEPKFAIRFLSPKDVELISKYEDVSIEKSVKGQLKLANCKITGEEKSDIVLIVNNFEDVQGELVMGVNTKHFSSELSLPNKPYAIADVRFANGADRRFVRKMFRKKLDKKFYGYSAWNTSANTVGSLICAALVRFLATDYDDLAFKKVQAVRFLDDWAYQAIVRQKLKKQSDKPHISELKKLMKPYEKKVFSALDLDFDVKYKFPWKRFFEVEVAVTLKD